MAQATISRFILHYWTDSKDKLSTFKSCQEYRKGKGVLKFENTLKIQAIAIECYMNAHKLISQPTKTTLQLNLPTRLSSRYVVYKHNMQRPRPILVHDNIGLLIQGQCLYFRVRAFTGPRCRHGDSGLRDKVPSSLR